MVDVDFPTVVGYGFALFFVFAVAMIWVIRYSNAQIMKKISELKQNMASEMAKLDHEMRRIVLANSKERAQMLEENGKLKKANGIETPSTHVTVAKKEQEKEKPVKIVA